MMEVDMQSPPSTFRPVPFAIKRPRSPGSPTQERQVKRPSLVPVGSDGHGSRRASTATDGVADGRVASQDDWVRQARELSITSPLSITAGFPLVIDGSATVAQSRVDEHMAVDDEESQMLRGDVHPGSSRPWATKGHLPSIHITTSTQASVSVPNGLHALSPAPFSLLTEPPSSSSESASSTSSISVTRTSVGANAARLCPPDIFLFPATPSDTPPDQHESRAEDGESVLGPHARMQDQSLSQSSLARTLDRVDANGSPRPSRTPDMPSAVRKHRVTMGPRADCVKCRTGVRGHWMHFD